MGDVILKQLIIMVAMILLGLFMYGIIAGDEEGSVYSSLGEVWKQGKIGRAHV